MPSNDVPWLLPRSPSGANTIWLSTDSFRDFLRTDRAQQKSSLADSSICSSGCPILDAESSQLCPRYLMHPSGITLCYREIFTDFTINVYILGFQIHRVLLLEIYSVPTLPTIYSSVTIIILARGTLFLLRASPFMFLLYRSPLLPHRCSLSLPRRSNLVDYHQGKSFLRWRPYISHSIKNMAPHAAISAQEAAALLGTPRPSKDDGLLKIFFLNLQLKQWAAGKHQRTE